MSNWQEQEDDEPQQQQKLRNRMGGRTVAVAVAVTEAASDDSYWMGRRMAGKGRQQRWRGSAAN